MAQLYIVLLLLILVTPALQAQIRPRLDPVEFDALLEIKSSLTDIPGSAFFSTWMFNSNDPEGPEPCSTFLGILCSHHKKSNSLRVDSLTLGTGLADSPGLTGSLSDAITKLTFLTQFILFSGNVTGSIPSQLGELTSLRVISLSKNRLTGPIPGSIATLWNLHTLDLSYNQLSGVIPVGLTQLPALKVLVLTSNQFNGEFPTIFTQLLHLDLKCNAFNGNLMMLPLSLRYLSVSGNKMWGPISKENLVSLISLSYLDLSMNQFNGTIPQLLFDGKSNISTMLLQRNNFTGGIRVGSFREYGEASVVDLSHNFLEGEVPVGLAGVENVFLNNNMFTGKVPDEYTRRLYAGSLETLYVQHNYLTGFLSKEADGLALPSSAALCMSYNCMVPRVADSGSCPSISGGLVSRPMRQCTLFNNGTTPFA